MSSDGYAQSESKNQYNNAVINRWITRSQQRGWQKVDMAVNVPAREAMGHSCTEKHLLLELLNACGVTRCPSNKYLSCEGGTYVLDVLLN
jgi:hypothetical protein